MINRKTWIKLFAAALLAPAASAAIISDGPGLGVTTDWAGVGMLGTASSFSATGTLIGPHSVLTAAHVVQGITGTQARFQVNGITYASSAVAINPGYTGGDDFDLAVVTLSQDVLGVPFYQYNTGALNELTAGPGIKVGFGVGGSGATGAQPALYPYGTKRAGSNTIDMVTTSTTHVTDGLGNPFTVPAGMLLYDFDNHLTGTNGPLGGPAVGATEIDTATGDSGGPMFQFSTALNAYIITGITIGGSDDLSRYGDIANDLRVASYAPWIASQVPEPSSIAMIAAIALLCGHRRRL
ncbi:MAG: sorting protein [Phycisphaerales bacterium]|nr:sorting protein [Phycisphaerales bacterium]